MKLHAFVVISAALMVASCAEDDTGSPATQPPATSPSVDTTTASTAGPGTDPAVTTPPVTDVAVTEAPTTLAPPPQTLNTKGADGPYDESRDPRADIAVALEIAAAQGKLVLLDFGANWCPDCLVLDELYSDPAVAALLDEHYVLVTIDVGEFDRNMDLSAEYNGAADVGIPALVVLDADGTILGDTHQGEFASASTFQPDDVLEYLNPFVS